MAVTAQMETRRHLTEETAATAATPAFQAWAVSADPQEAEEPGARPEPAEQVADRTLNLLATAETAAKVGLPYRR